MSGATGGGLSHKSAPGLTAETPKLVRTINQPVSSCPEFHKKFFSNRKFPTGRRLLIVAAVAGTTSLSRSVDLSGFIFQALQCVAAEWARAAAPCKRRSFSSGGREGGSKWPGRFCVSLRQRCKCTREAWEGKKAAKAKIPAQDYRRARSCLEPTYPVCKSKTHSGGGGQGRLLFTRFSGRWRNSAIQPQCLYEISRGCFRMLWVFFECKN